MTIDRYPEEILDEESDNGTMPDNVDQLRQAVVGHRIVSIEKEDYVPGIHYGDTTVITLDNGKRVRMVDTNDCCAGTEMEAFCLHPELVDHMIMGVGTTDGYTSWHIYADLGDVVELTLNWGCGNPFYYGYGFDIIVEEIPQP